MPGARSEPTRFMDREIDVEAAEDAPRRPVAFSVAGRRYVVAGVLSTWEDEAPGAARRGRPSYHRTFYRLRTEDGDVFDIYFDEGESRRRHRDRWVLHRRLAAAPAAGAAEPAAAPSPQGEAAGGSASQPAAAEEGAGGA